MYGIFTHIYHKNQPNVGKYIHGWYGLYDFPHVLWVFAISLRASAVQFGRCIRELTPVVRTPGKWWCILGVQIFGVSKLHEYKKIYTIFSPVFEMCLFFFFRFFKESMRRLSNKNERFLINDILAFLFSASR